MSRVKGARRETMSPVGGETSQRPRGAANQKSRRGGQVRGVGTSCSLAVAARPQPAGHSRPGAPLVRNPEAVNKCGAWGLLADRERSPQGATHQKPRGAGQVRGVGTSCGLAAATPECRCSCRGFDSLCVSGAANFGRRGRRRRAPAARSRRGSCRAAPKPPPDCRRHRRSRPLRCARRTAREGSRGVRP